MSLSAILPRVLTVALAFTLTLGLTACAKKGADVVFQNGRIFTGDPEQPWAQALAVARGKIVQVGTNEDAEAFVGMQTRVRDLAGRCVLPGIREPAYAPYVLEQPDRVLFVEPVSQGRFFEYARRNKETQTGAVAVGRYADLIILDRNPFETSPHEVRWLERVVEGRTTSATGS